MPLSIVCVALFSKLLVSKPIHGREWISAELEHQRGSSHMGQQGALLAGCSEAALPWRQAMRWRPEGGSLRWKGRAGNDAGSTPGQVEAEQGSVKSSEAQGESLSTKCRFSRCPGRRKWKRLMKCAWPTAGASHVLAVLRITTWLGPW
uniref:Uncharacterized protein n=1 Tax=Myotis myotis TaxID=51298 RepID=A0A7J7Z5M1_MYOMY|nr:hypothetical protein mMyoMyo1_010399 [Myotis myotis]